MTDGWNYFGWVPTVSGWLSFSHAGSVQKSHYLLKASAFNNTLKNKKGIPALVAYQQRNLSDRPFASFPSFLHGSLVRRGYWEFFCCLRPSKKEGEENREVLALEGKIWVISSTSADVAEAQRIVNELRSFEKEDAEKFRKLLDESFTKAKVAWYCAEVCIRRDGLCQIGSISRSDSQIISDASASDPTSRRQANSWLCAFEIYSFIKDIFHRHKYHALDDDTIAPLIAISPNSDATLGIQYEDSLKAWSRATSHYLHSSVINFSRNTNRIEALQDAKGILSYLDSFQETHQKNAASPEINVSALESSIKNSIDKEDFVRKDWRALFAFVSLMILAPFAALTGALKDVVGKSIPQEIVNAYATAFLLILLVGWYVYIRRAVPMGLGFSWFGRANSLFLSALVAFPTLRRTVGYGLLVFAVALMYIVFKLLT